MASDSGLHIPAEDLILETELRIARENGYESFRCSCMKCRGGRQYNISTIQWHLREYKRDPYLMRSMVGGDPVVGYPTEAIRVNASGERFPEANVFDDSDIRTEYAEHLDPYHDVQRQIFDAFDEGDRLREDRAVDSNEVCDGADMSERMDALHDLYQQATNPMYSGTNVSIISATIVLINMAVVHGVSNAFVDELLKYLSTVLLLKHNRLPHNHYEARKLIRKLGFNYNIIHACSEGCVLYRGPHENLKECPNSKCGKSRYIEGSDVIPVRVIRHFPLIPRLMRMYRFPAIAEMLRFHSDHPNMNDGVMKSVADSPAWKHIDSNVDPPFAEDGQNLRFGMSLDGVNPFPHSNTSHSTWPVLMLIYNLPLYLVTKKFFVQLSILISGKFSPTSDNIDVFIRLVLEELLELWKGVPCQDFSKPPGEQQFTLRGLLMWTISDYPGYGLISGLCTHGYKGCTVCGPDTDARSAKSGNKLDAQQQVKGRKIVYGGGRRWIHMRHPYCRNLSFNGKVELRGAPKRMSAEESNRCGAEREAYIAGGGSNGGN